MKLLSTLLFCGVLMTACKKDNQTTQNSSSICFETTFLNTNIQDGLMSVFFLNGKDGFVTYPSDQVHIVIAATGL